MKNLADEAFKTAQKRLSEPPSDEIGQAPSSTGAIASTAKASEPAVRLEPRAVRPRHHTSPGVAPPPAGAPQPPSVKLQAPDGTSVPSDKAFPIVVPPPSSPGADIDADAKPREPEPVTAPLVAEAVDPSRVALSNEPIKSASAPEEAEPVRRERPADPEVPPMQPTGSTRAKSAHPPGGASAAYETLTKAPRLADLVAITTTIVTAAARSRRTDWSYAAKVSSLADEHKLARADAETPFGNALKVLTDGPYGEGERALACALWAHAIAESPRKRPEDEDRLASDILWLATHTPFDATALLDRALGEEASELWTAIASRVREPEALRGEVLVGVSALAGSTSSRARALAAEIARDSSEPALGQLVSTEERPSSGEVRLEGEIVPSPRGSFVTALLAFTGILFVTHAVRIVARLALAYRRPAEVSLSSSGVRVKTRTEMLGRTLREREHVILRSGLVRVVREVRYPRAAFYAGLLALAVGSYIGVRTFVDGVRAASPSLLVVGLVIVALGIGADFVLGTLVPGSRGRCRVAFVPRAGAVVSVGNVDLSRVDDALARTLKA